MTEVYVLQTGSLHRDTAGQVLNAHATVSLICSCGEKILVDTGAAVDDSIIVGGLARLGLTADDITLVINTHGHDDHSGGNQLFKNARFIAHTTETGLIGSYPKGAEYEFVQAPKRVASHVLIFPTPGHTCGCLSVVVEKANAEFGASSETVVIAGDALPLQGNYIKMIPPAICQDRQSARVSLQSIVDLAHWVIPGHDQPFRVMPASDSLRL